MRIRVFNRATQTYGTINEEDFNDRLFEKEDTQQPLEKKISETGAFDRPVLGGLLRGVEAPIESYGRMVGGAGYEAGRSALSALGNKDVYGNQNPFLSEEDLQKLSSGGAEGAKRTLGAMLTAASVWGAPGLVKNLPNIGRALISKPSTTIGRLRTATLGSKTTSTPQLEAETLKKLLANKFYRGAPAESKQMARSRLSEFLGNLNPARTVGEGGTMKIEQSAQTPLNRIYEDLSPFEQMGKGYTRSGEPGGTALGQGTNLASRAVREYMTGQNPATANLLNKLYGTTLGAEKLAGRAVAPLAIGGAGYYLIRTLLSKFLPYQ